MQDCDLVAFILMGMYGMSGKTRTFFFAFFFRRFVFWWEFRSGITGFLCHLSFCVKGKGNTF